MISLINIHDLNPRHIALNQLHRPHTKSVTIRDSANLTRKIQSPTRLNTLPKNIRDKKIVLKHICEPA